MNKIEKDGFQRLELYEIQELIELQDDLELEDIHFGEEEFTTSMER